MRICVRDRGPGILDAFLERMFDPFYRVDRSRARHTAGTGLGLAPRLERDQGGDLGLSNRPEGGRNAEFTLPR